MKAPTENLRKAEIAKAAERLFALTGYDATSIRDVAAAAGVNSALVRYHFGSKQDLYKALFERRYHDITAHRLKELDAIDLEPNSIDSLAYIVRIWIVPLFEMLNDPLCRDFARLLAHESLHSTNDDHGIFRAYLDPSAKKFIAAMQRIVPAAPRRDVVLSYLWMVTCVTCSEGISVRMKRLLGSGRSHIDPAYLPEKVSVFLTNGIWAMLHPE
jgi:AcrR family transcriptional regulator